MTLTLFAKTLSLLLASVVPAALVGVLEIPPHDEGCSGCVAQQKVTIFRWTQPNANIPASWEGNAGSMDIGAPNVTKDKDGRCKHKPLGEGEDAVSECGPDPDYPCESEASAIVNNVAPQTYVNGLGWGCKTWASASADNKKLEGSVAGCGNGTTDFIEAHASSACATAVGSLRGELKIECTHCTYTPR